MSVNNRLEQLIKALYKGNKSAFASAIGVAPSVIENIVGKRQGKPSFDVVEKISSIAEINIEWLVTGTGDMFKQNKKPRCITAPIKSISTNKSSKPSSLALEETSQRTSDAIPLVSEMAVGGFANEHFSIQEADVLAYYIIPKFRNLGVDFMIELTGDSMIPRLFPGDIIACSIIRNASFIQWNKPHLIATREQGLIVKRLRKSLNDDCLLAVSDNADYDPFDLPKDEILALARVVGVIHLE